MTKVLEVQLLVTDGVKQYQGTGYWGPISMADSASLATLFRNIGQAFESSFALVFSGVYQDGDVQVLAWSAEQRHTDRDLDAMFRRDVDCHPAYSPERVCWEVIRTTRPYYGGFNRG